MENALILQYYPATTGDETIVIWEGTDEEQLKDEYAIEDGNIYTIYKCYMSHILDDGNHMQIDADTEAEARGLMLEYLYKEGLI